MHKATPSLALIVLCESLFHMSLADCSCEEGSVRTHVSSSGQRFEFHRCQKRWIALTSESDDSSIDQEKMLSLPGRLFDFNFAEGDFRVGGKSIYVSALQKRTTSEQVDADTGLTIWDGSVILAKYLEHRGNLDGKRVLALGSGVGLVGISCGVLGAAVTMTDLDYVMDSLNHNIDKNKASISSGSLIGLPLDWTNWEGNAITKQPFDIVLGADIVWLQSLIVPLCDLLKEISIVNRNCEILISYQSRSKMADHVLYNSLEQRSFKVSKVLKDEMPSSFVSKRLDILKLEYIPQTKDV